MATFSRIFAILAMLYGIGLTVAAFAWAHPMLQPLHGKNILPFTFITSVVFFVPFVITYTQLGLNTAEGEKPSTESSRRLARLAAECPIWQVAWCAAIGLVSFSFFAFMLVGDSVNPLFAFSAAISGFSGLWFAFVYPTAVRLFGSASSSRK